MKKKKKLKVFVTNKNAIYVDGIRITNRNTKWGIHEDVDSFECLEAELIGKLKERGHERIIKLIEKEELERFGGLT